MRKVQKLANTLKEKGLDIAFAESITCGLLVQQIGNISDTSEILKGSIVCYHPSVKEKLFKINPTLIEKYSAESQEVTNELAKNLKKIINADICAAITGLASSGGSETKTKPKGTIFFSIYFKGQIFQHYKKFNGTPLEIKKKCCDEMYDFILKKIT